MGQRHQLFVIGKISGRYRGLAAVHHQWLYGAGPLKACIRLLRIFSDPSNRRLLHHELKQAESLSESEWTAKPDMDNPKENPNIQFPFIATCLVLGASYDPTTGEASKVHALDFNTAVGVMDNNDGVTVVDITEPSKPRYCFLALHGGETQAKRMVPLRAMEYLSAYQRFDKHPEGLVKSFELYELIKISSLNDAWPRDDWRSSSRAQCGGLDLSKLDIGSNSVVKENQQPSLRRLSLQKTIEDCLQSSDVGPYLSELQLLPDFLTTLLSCLRSRPKEIDEAPCGMQLLSMVLQNKSEVDLSPFTTLTDTAVLQLVSDAQLQQTMKSLDLSGNHHITASLFVELGKSCQVLEKTYLINTPQLALDAVYTAFSEKSGIEVIHSESFLRVFCPGTPSRPRVFQPRSDDYDILPLRQILWLCSKISNVPHSRTGAIQWTKFDTEEGTRSSSSSSLSCFFDKGLSNPLHGAAITLTDMYLSCKATSRVLSSFLRFIASSHPLTSQTFGTLSTLGCGSAMAFAMTGDATYQVHTIPARLYDYGAQCYHSSAAVAPRFTSVKEGEWTIIVTGIQELTAARRGFAVLSYAFVTKESGSDKLVVLDFPGFAKINGLQQSDDAITVWERDFKSINMAFKQAGMMSDVEVITEEEVEEVLLCAEEHERRRKALIESIPILYSIENES